MSWCPELQGRAQTQFGRTAPEARQLMEAELRRVGVYGQADWEWKDGGLVS